MKRFRRCFNLHNGSSKAEKTSSSTDNPDKPMKEGLANFQNPDRFKGPKAVKVFSECTPGLGRRIPELYSGKKRACRSKVC